MVADTMGVGTTGAAITDADLRDMVVLSMAVLIAEDSAVVIAASMAVMDSTEVAAFTAAEVSMAAVGSMEAPVAFMEAGAPMVGEAEVFMAMEATAADTGNFN